MRARCCFLLLLCLASAPVQANLVLEIAQQVQSQGQVVGTFTQEKHIQMLPLPISSSGRFEFDPEQGIVWQLLAPIQESFAIPAGDSFSLPAKGAEESAIASTRRIIFWLLSGQFQALSDQFLVTAEGDIASWKILLTPKDEVVSRFIQSIRVEGGLHLQRVSVQERNGDKSVIHLATLGNQ